MCSIRCTKLAQKILQTKNDTTSYARGQTNLHPMENDAVVVPALGQPRHIVTGARCMTIIKLHDERPDACCKLDVRVRLLSSGLVGSGHCVCLLTSDIQRRCFCWVMSASTIAYFSPLLLGLRNAEWWSGHGLGSEPIGLLCLPATCQTRKRCQY